MNSSPTSTIMPDATRDELIEEIELLRRFVRVQCQTLGAVMSAKFAIENGEDGADKIRDLARYCVNLGYSVVGFSPVSEVKPKELKDGSAWWVRVRDDDYGWSHTVTPAIFIGNDVIEPMWDLLNRDVYILPLNVQPISPIATPPQEMVDLIPLPGENHRP